MIKKTAHNIFSGFRFFLPAFFFVSALSVLCGPARAEMIDYGAVKLQMLDKTTARTMTFEVGVGETVRFGSMYIRPQACRKSPPIETPESASFLQVWEVDPDGGKSKWIFSGWMFASSPALSPMDNPIYDVWVLDCDKMIVKTDDGAGNDAKADQPNSGQPNSGQAAQAPVNDDAVNGEADDAANSGQNKNADTDTGVSSDKPSSDIEVEKLDN